MLDVDVMQVSHHGSYNGTTEALLAEITPEIAVIEVGKSATHKQWTAWAYGHPRKQAIDMLEKWVKRTRSPVTEPVATAVHSFTPITIRHAIYATGWDGPVVVTADTARHYSITTGASH